MIAVDLPGEGFAYDTDADEMGKNNWETFAREWMVSMKPVFKKLGVGASSIRSALLPSRN